MATVNRNMFDTAVTVDRPCGGSLMALPLNLIAVIISHVDDQGDLARLCRTCRVLNYMSLPELYRHMVLTSYDRIRYRDEQPEGMGSASPFTMGLNAVITRPFAALVRSLTLRGDWREQELEEHARVGRVPDASMLLNIAVRAAVDRMTDLESFSWELSTKMLETVYLGLAQRPRLQSLTLRFPSSRHPRPTVVIPAMPHLRYLKVTDIDPLCYPDDISTLLFNCRKLRELKMHWSPRMRNEQEPSVKLHDYFRKCIAARRPLAVKKLGLQNLYALHSEEFNLAFDSSVCEDVTILSNTGSESPYLMNTFVDSTWPTAPPNTQFHIKSVRQDNTSRRHVDFLGTFTGLERLYFVSATGAHVPDHVNNARRPPRLTEDGLAQTDGTIAPPPPPLTPVNSPGVQASIRDNYLNVIGTNHAATLRHLLLPAHWPLSATAVARLMHASPQLEQLGFASDKSSMETLGLLIPFLRKLEVLRLLVPTGPGTPTPPGCAGRGTGDPSDPAMRLGSARTLAEVVEADDQILVDLLSEAMGDPQTFSQLKIIGLGRKGFQLGGYHTVPVSAVDDRPVESQCRSQSQSQTPTGTAPPTSTTTPDDGRATTTSPDSRGDAPAGLDRPWDCKLPTPRPQPPSSLGKRQREDEHPWVGDTATDDDSPIVCMPPILATADGRLWRRQVKRVGWETLRHWEIWGLDTQEL